MNSLEAVTSLSLYLSKRTDIKIFKNYKSVNYKGEYIVINSLPFVYGRLVNDDNALNLNVHVPEKSNGEIDSKRLSEIASTIENLIPFTTDIEDGSPLCINGVYYSIHSCSNPILDNDKTHFINYIVDIVFTNLKTN